jgi:hypothetical protein
MDLEFEIYEEVSKGKASIRIPKKFFIIRIITVG